jgi:CO/xanthine dehydrogenase FAD-binding subunit
MHVRSSVGSRTLTAAEFFLGPLTTALDAQECLQEIHWPVWNERRVGSSFMEVSRRHGDFAMIEACAQVAVDDNGHCTRVVFGLGGGGTTPLAFPALSARLIGTRLDDDLVQSVAQEAAVQLDAGSDLHASAEYRKHLATVLAARVIRAAAAEALDKS